MTRGLGSVAEQRSPKPLTGVRFPQPLLRFRNMKNLTDEQLVKNYLKGDEKALEDIVRQYLPLIYNFSRRYSGDPDNASDISQEVFVKVWKNLKKFDASKNFKAWLFSIAKNTALDWFKKKRDLSLSDFADSIIDAKQLPITDEIYKKSLLNNVQLAIEKLPQKYGSIINLYHTKGLNFREIADFLKEPINTVKSRYRRGLISLKKKLSPNL